MSSPYRNHRTSSPFQTNKRAQSEDRTGQSKSRNNSPRPSAAKAQEESTVSFLSYPVSKVANSLYRRFTEDINGYHARQSSLSSLTVNTQPIGSNTGPLYTPKRTASPFAPPPLTGLTLRGHRAPKQQILSRGLAEEIRLLLPPRLQLAADWTLAYSIETDGVSLGTLYDRCAAYAGKGHGFVLVVKDGTSGIFGAYLTDPPHPSPHYFGTGECFLWRATILPVSSLLSNLPPPPSADTSNLQRSTTILASASDRVLLSPWTPPGSVTSPPKSPQSATSEKYPSEDLSDRIRFKAFPYSGMNDYMIFCESNYLSVGGGDGHYGLWLDSVLERGISSSCPTFGNEPLSEEGEKFEVLGVEVWWVGS